MKESSNQQDKILLTQAKHGDPEAFGLIFDKYNRKIYRFVYFKVSSVDVAEDITSQVFLKTWEQISQGLKIKTFQAWLYRIARNLIVDYYRTREKEELPLIYELEDQNQNQEFDPDKNLQQDELKKLLLTLKPDVKEIIILRYIEDLSIKEISQIVDKSSAYVRVILHRAIADLKGKIKNN